MITLNALSREVHLMTGASVVVAAINTGV